MTNPLQPEEDLFAPDAKKSEEGMMGEDRERRLKWHVPDNLRWLAAQPGRPAYTPCGALTGALLNQAADMIVRRRP